MVLFVVPVTGREGSKGTMQITAGHGDSGNNAYADHASKGPNKGVVCAEGLMACTARQLTLSITQAHFSW